MSLIAALRTPPRHRPAPGAYPPPRRALHWWCPPGDPGELLLDRVVEQLDLIGTVEVIPGRHLGIRVVATGRVAPGGLDLDVTAVRMMKLQPTLGRST